MSARGFLLAIHDDDSFDQPVMRPISPNITISRSDFFHATEGGKYNYIVVEACMKLVIISTNKNLHKNDY